ncbi:MAG: phosphoribosylglycinamide formyltransferase [Candidatus Gracilibacteria bacterium]
MRNFKIGVLASGNGTDLGAIFEEMDAGKMPKEIDICVVISNVEDSKALEKARARNIRAVFVNPLGKTREDYDMELIKELGDVDLVCLIGYMRILSQPFVRHFARRIINVHPALLPKYGGEGWFGMKVHEGVLANKEKESGMTIHYVDFGVDSGPTIMQEKVPVYEDDTPETLRARTLELEKRCYPEVIRLLFKQFSDKQ